MKKETPPQTLPSGLYRVVDGNLYQISDSSIKGSLSRCINRNKELEGYILELRIRLKEAERLLSTAERAVAVGSDYDQRYIKGWWHDRNKWLF